MSPDLIAQGLRAQGVSCPLPFAHTVYSAALGDLATWSVSQRETIGPVGGFKISLDHACFWQVGIDAVAAVVRQNYDWWHYMVVNPKVERTSFDAEYNIKFREAAHNCLVEAIQQVYAPYGTVSVRSFNLFVSNPTLDIILEAEPEQVTQACRATGGDVAKLRLGAACSHTGIFLDSAGQPVHLTTSPGLRIILGGFPHRVTDYYRLRKLQHLL